MGVSRQTIAQLERKQDQDETAFGSSTPSFTECK